MGMGDVVAAGAAQRPAIRAATRRPQPASDGGTRAPGATGRATLGGVLGTGPTRGSRADEAGVRVHAVRGDTRRAGADIAPFDRTYIGNAVPTMGTSTTGVQPAVAHPRPSPQVRPVTPGLRCSLRGVVLDAPAPSGSGCALHPPMDRLRESGARSVQRLPVGMRPSSVSRQERWHKALQHRAVWARRTPDWKVDRRAIGLARQNCLLLCGHE